ncbi:hypothetical protein Y1Q_0015287 [Alligator mississippiensis]|uniref:Uncharacterized protein n=1 Tax=Alligator mississippiensis TaxID=8496 RepID=A0A151P3U7_ALLMI|nr:hypothetical protein Y1Q_0015287 [Alligator mississippiensis]
MRRCPEKQTCRIFHGISLPADKKDKNNALNSAIDNMCKKTRDLRRQLRKAIIDHVSDSFLDTTVPLLVLIEAAKNGREKEMKDYVAIFQEHASRLVEDMVHPVEHFHLYTLNGSEVISRLIFKASKKSGILHDSLGESASNWNLVPHQEVKENCYTRKFLLPASSPRLSVVIPHFLDTLCSQVANLACSLSTNEDGIKIIQMAANYIETICPQEKQSHNEGRNSITKLVINAALALSVRPKSQVLKNNMDMYKSTWENHIHVFTEAVDDITSIDDFLAVSGR